MLTHLVDKLGDNIEWAMIAQEEHKEGGLHLHCLVKLHKKCESRNARFLDHGEYHPNIQSAKSISASVKYLCKEDPDPLCFKIDLENLKKSVGGKTKIVSDSLIQVKSN